VSASAGVTTKVEATASAIRIAPVRLPFMVQR
jgi:hypothetical protein